MKFNNLYVVAVIFLTLIAACSNKSSILTFEPELLEDCKQGHEVNVNWDIKGAYPNTKNIALYVGGGGKESLFAQGGITGSAKTGPWAFPGTHFTLRDNDTKQLLEEASIDGPKCK